MGFWTVRDFARNGRPEQHGYSYVLSIERSFRFSKPPKGRKETSLERARRFQAMLDSGQCSIPGKRETGQSWPESWA